MTHLQSNMYILSANSRFTVQIDGMYLHRKTRETCIFIWEAKAKNYLFLPLALKNEVIREINKICLHILVFCLIQPSYNFFLKNKTKFYLFYTAYIWNVAYKLEVDFGLQICQIPAVKVTLKITTLQKNAEFKMTLFTSHKFCCFYFLFTGYFGHFKLFAVLSYSISLSI